MSITAIASILLPIAKQAGAPVLGGLLKRAVDGRVGPLEPVIDNAIDTIVGQAGSSVDTFDIDTVDHGELAKTMVQYEEGARDVLLAVIEADAAMAQSSDTLVRRMRPVIAFGSACLAGLIAIVSMAWPERGAAAADALQTLPAAFWALALGPTGLWMLLRSIEKHTGRAS